MLFGFGLPAVLLATIVAQHRGVGGVELGASALGAPHMRLQIDRTSLSFFLLLTLIASTCAGLRMSYVYQGGTPRKLYFLFY